MADYTRLTNLDVTDFMKVGGVITAPAGVVGNVTGNVTGAVTGNVIGNVTGSAVKSEARTATATGATTGTISVGVTYVVATSASAANIIILPAPVSGLRITIFVAAVGYELQTSAPATITINDGGGAVASSSVAANVIVRAECVSSTRWIASTVTAAGVVGVLEAAH